LSKVTLEQVELLADMARLTLSAAEKECYTQQLNNVLAVAACLDEIDTTQVEPTTYLVPQRNVMRPDISRPGLPIEQVMANAPAEQDGFFHVPRILAE
jgi:aspartyl-tRNA(Asn)/glutamyl-tRNA(Gln) amidotransferase subunit C